MPLVVSPSLVANTPADELADRLKRPHIGYHNLLRSRATDVPAPLTNPLTWDRWTGSQNAASVIEFSVNNLAAPAPPPYNYIGIASHNLGSRGGGLVTVEKTDAFGTYLPVVSFSPTTDDALMVLFDDLTPNGTVDQWRITIAQAGVAPQIGALYLGRALVMPHCIYGGHSPATLSRETEIEPNVSIGGRFLGRSIIRRGYRTDYEFRHLPAQWYREHFEPFVEHALRDPFFIAWKPDKFPAEVLYGWTTDDLRPVNMGIRDLMSVSFGVEGYR